VRLVCSYRTCTVISTLAGHIEIMCRDDVDPDLEVSDTTHKLPDSPEDTNIKAHGSSADRKSRIALACKRCKRRKQRVSLEFPPCLRNQTDSGMNQLTSSSVMGRDPVVRHVSGQNKHVCTRGQCVLNTLVEKHC
jgi:hypothetical protein